LYGADCLIEVTSLSSLLKALDKLRIPADEIDLGRGVLENPGMRCSAPGEAAAATTTVTSTGTTWMGICGAFATGLVVVGLVMIGRAPSIPPLPRDGTDCALRVSWDFPFKGFKTFPINDRSRHITIGNSNVDSIYSPELLARHVGIGVEDDLLTLTCRGPVLLADGTVLAPSMPTPLVKHFQKGEVVSFAAGESGFVVNRVSKV
jgi:hypothetical protein